MKPQPKRPRDDLNQLAKQMRVAIQNAASVAVPLITTEAMVAEVPKKNAGGGLPACLRAAAAWAIWISKSSRSEFNNQKGPMGMPVSPRDCSRSWMRQHSKGSLRF